MPLVSVIIPTLNRQDLLMRSIQSVLAQTFEDFELVIVDDGSDDNTEVKVKQIKDKRIFYTKSAFNKGAQAARVKGVWEAKGDFICFLDSDDEWYPDKLEKQVKTFGNLPDSVGVVHGDCDIYYEATGEKKLFMVPKLSGAIYEKLLRRPGPMYQCLMVRRKCFEETPGAIDPDVPSYQEWDTSINLSKKYDFYFIDEPLMVYNRHKGETISYDSLRDIKGYLYIVEKHRDEILKYCGREALGNHYYIVARKYYLSVKDRAFAEEFFKKARQYGIKDIFTLIACFSPGFAMRLQTLYGAIKRVLYIG